MDPSQSEFLLEIESLLDRIFLDLEALRDSALDTRSRRDSIDRLFRHVHSVKGSAASCGLTSVSKIAHELEHLLDGARSDRIVLDELTLDTCCHAADALSESLALSVSGVAEPNRRQLFEKLQTLAGGVATDDSESFLSRVPTEVWQNLTESERYRLVRAIRERSQLYILSTSFDTARFDEAFFGLKESVAEWGEVLSTSPTVDALHPDKINFRVLYASQHGVDQLEQNLTAFPDVALGRVEISEEQTIATIAIQSIQPSVSSLANFIRTDLDTLDRIISSTHQLFRKTSHAFDLADCETDESRRRLHQDIRASFLSVEEELINLRMVSLGPTLQRAARAGKTAARLVGKEISFVVSGGDLRIDKLLADAIADPLIHLCRNAVDHGIEDSKVRSAAGKSLRGTIRLDASSEGGRLRVRVLDDGRGIDPKVITTAAKRLGISESDEGLDFERSLRLIFRPGFSTLESASDLSGRGVGLDVVETAVEQAGGELRVSSKPGAGSTFEIRLPVTFGLMNATVVVSGGNRYCIAAAQTPLSDAREEQLQKFSLNTLLGHSEQDAKSRPDPTGPLHQNSALLGTMLTCEFSDERNCGSNEMHRVRILVDDIQGTEKVLVRTLGRHAGRWYGVAGATELRDGSVALVLDLPRLLSGLE